MARRMRVAMEPGRRAGTHFYHIEDGWHYHLSYEEEGVKYYKCVRYERGCRGRATFDVVDGFVHSTRQGQGHNHGPDLDYPDEMAARRMILRRCEALDHVSYQQIIQEETRWFNDEVKSRVTYAVLRNSMRNARLKQYPNLPQTLMDLTTILRNQQYSTLTMTEDGEDNLYGGSVTDAEGGHHVLFISERMLQRMSQFTVLHSDGTFKAVPVNKDFAEQVFCIVGVWNHHIIPLAWVIMESRSEVAYTAVLQLLRQRLPGDIELTRIIGDFECAQQNAWTNVFGVATQGCLWHLSRAFMQQVVDLDLLRDMRRIFEVRRIIRLTLALPLLPADLITEGFRLIMREARNEGNFIYRKVRPFLLYVWRNWVSRPWRRAQMSTFGSSQRTNNACESQNRMVREKVGTHPNVYDFIAGLVKLEQQMHTVWITLERGRKTKRGRKRTSIMNDQRIEQLSQELFDPPGPINRTIFRFLRVASHTMDNMVNEALEARRDRQVNNA